jgi:membrane protease YdiL (CAAX protease family)
MSAAADDYWARARHPWSCVLFVLPLLAVYELGLYSLSPSSETVLRNGADVWMRSGLASAGLSPSCAAPLVLLLILAAWTLFYREERPRDPLGVWVGMTVESTTLAAVLYGASQGLWPVLYSLCGMLDGAGGHVPALVLRPSLSLGSGSDAADPAVANLVRYVGAGIYEEALFRLLFFSGLLTAFNVAELPRRWAIGLAVLASALLFAGAHNLGPRGETFECPLFIFRTLAGAYFAWIYCVRGFGIAVGAHAGYDVLVELFAKVPV